MNLVQEILSAFRARVQDRLQIVRAEVTTAVKLSADRRDAIAQRLGEVTGKQVLIDARVDPSIIGGVVAKISSTVYDGSVATQLERLREQLESGT
jgi:F-type H+-transporting ATPase subunit delta